MALSLAQSLTAVAPNITSSFAASGGTSPYTYAVLAGGAGGTINASTGVYTAPAVSPVNASLQFDTIQVTDSLSATATATILVAPPILLVCDILQTYLGLATGRVYIWNQKLFQPTDAGLYIAVSQVHCKPFANNNGPATIGGVLDWSQSNQYTVFQATLDLNIISRDMSAFYQKEYVIMALNSQYALQQQYANNFYIGRIPPNAAFLNLSEIDGAAIPYRYQISVNIQYAISNIQSAPYINQFESVGLYTNP